MTNFAGTDRTIPCGASTPAGPCGRRVEPGNSCGFHPPPPIPEPQPRPTPICRCERSWPISDRDGVRCLKCARAIADGDLAEKRGPEPPSNGSNGSAPCDPSPDPTPELDLTHRTPGRRKEVTTGGRAPLTHQ